MAETLLDFLSKPVTHQPMLIKRGVLPLAGKAIIGGLPKSNKSFVALNIIKALAEGSAVFGAYYSEGVPVLGVTKPCKVLYIEQEIGADGLRERLLGMSHGEIENLPIFIKTRDTKLQLDSPAGQAAIRKELDEVKPDVLVMDPLAKFHVQDENSAQFMGAIMRVGDKFIEDYGCAIIYIHHTGKPSDDPEKERGRRGGNRLRGSSAIFADVDTFIEVSNLSGEQASEPVLKLSFEIRRGKPIPPILVRRREDGNCTYHGESFVDTGFPNADTRAAARRVKEENPFSKTRRTEPTFLKDI